MTAYINTDELENIFAQCAAEMGLDLQDFTHDIDWIDGPRHYAYGDDVEVEGDGDIKMYVSGFKFNASLLSLTDSFTVSGRFAKPVLVGKAQYTNGLASERTVIFDGDRLAHAVNAVAGAPLFTPQVSRLGTTFMDVWEGLCAY